MQLISIQQGEMSWESNSPQEAPGMEIGRGNGGGRLEDDELSSSSLRDSLDPLFLPLNRSPSLSRMIEIVEE
ncbi:dynein heavy chain 7, axonemal-like [Sesbania bispinosa]|nr:dynein heavy chain 7, axonemal-like [Sesbania bispinosa]